MARQSTKQDMFVGKISGYIENRDVAPVRGELNMSITATIRDKDIIFQLKEEGDKSYGRSTDFSITLTHENLAEILSAVLRGAIFPHITFSEENKQ